MYSFVNACLKNFRFLNELILFPLFAFSRVFSSRHLTLYLYLDTCISSSLFFDQVMTVVIQLVFGFPILLLPMIPYLGGSEDWNRIAVISFLVIFFLLLLIAVMPTGAENPGFWETFVR